MAKHNILGKKGEEIATRYISAKGYKILERNWRFSRDEIDIIAKDGETIVIIEVKTRSTDYYGRPEEAVTQRKQEFLIRAAEEYVIQNEIDNELRFDIFSVIIEKDKQTIRHIEDAFYPTI